VPGHAPPVDQPATDANVAPLTGAYPTRCSLLTSLATSLSHPPEVPKPRPLPISVGAASAANASGSLQTALSKVTRRSAPVPARSVSRRVTSDRVLTSIGHYRKPPSPRWVATGKKSRTSAAIALGTQTRMRAAIRLYLVRVGCDFRSAWLRSRADVSYSTSRHVLRRRR
jgi:hypothetical protein